MRQNLQERLQGTNTIPGNSEYDSFAKNNDACLDN